MIPTRFLFFFRAAKIFIGIHLIVAFILYNTQDPASFFIDVQTDFHTHRFLYDGSDYLNTIYRRMLTAMTNKLKARLENVSPDLYYLNTYSTGFKDKNFVQLFCMPWAYLLAISLLVLRYVCELVCDWP
jgi:hypothetical protein